MDVDENIAFNWPLIQLMVFISGELPYEGQLNIDILCNYVTTSMMFCHNLPLHFYLRVIFTNIVLHFYVIFRQDILTHNLP